MPDLARAALTTPRHVAVVGGPDSGWIAPLRAEPLVVGRGADATLCLDDPHLSRRHLALRDRRGRVQVRDLGSVNGTRLQRRRLRRRVGRRWRTVGVGARICAGGTVLEVRRHPGLGSRASAGDAPPHAEPVASRLLFPALMCVSAVPLLLGTGSSTWRVVAAVALPLLLVGGLLWPLVRERRRRARRPGPQAARVGGDAPDDPAGLLATALAGGEVEAWEIGDADARASPGRRRRYLEPPAPGAGLALVGAAEDTVALARWIACRVLVRAPGTVVETPWGTSAGTAGAASVEPPPRLRVVTAAGSAPVADTVSVVLADGLRDAPAWCTGIVEVRPGHDRRVGAAWAAAVTARVASAARPASTMPDEVHVESLLEAHDVAGVVRGWRTANGLRVVLGVAADGPVGLDLVADGPHALVAGTTGSGKSELLLAWLLSLAHASSPADLLFVLVDYKGGATFGPLSALPHVAGVLTDLDDAATSRALASLRAELVHRERLLAAAGAPDLAEYVRRTREHRTVPRLVVVVDEFRAMADAHPDLLDSLVRLAAQGRSLGIHLVLATQRPSGAVTPDMRANLTVRICLRVLEESDAVDVVGDRGAAHLPPVPGRAVLRTAERTVLQAAWCGPSADGVVARRVVLLRDAARHLERLEPWRVRHGRPWADPLPPHVDLDELEQADPSSTADALPLAVTDEPSAQRLGAWHLGLPGALLVSGPPRSGRSTALGTLARAAWRRGVVTHVVADDPVAVVGAGRPAPSLGTVCSPHDHVRARRLLDLLLEGATGGLLLVDGVDPFVAALDATTGPGGGMELLTTLLRRSRRLGLAVVLATPAPGRWAAAVSDHLVLRPRDVAEALMAGVPRDLVGTGWPAGRGVLLGPDGARVVHVARAGEGDGRGHRHPAVPPLRLVEPPDALALGVPGPPGILLGRGGDDAGEVRADLPDGGTWLVLGGASSGRTTALRTVAVQLRAAGRDVSTDPARCPEGPGGVLLLDDVDLLATDLLGRAAESLARGAALVASARPDPLLSAYHEVGVRLRNAPTALVLGAPPGAGHVVGTDLRRHTDPDPRPGRGVLVDRGRALRVQVARPE